jgi:U3 small nucleolar RNA-associated protein 18
MEDEERKGKAAWVDEDDDQLRIDLNKKNRLKKLKQGEEAIVSGTEFQSRLRDQYTKLNSKVDIYNWAFQEEQEKNESQDKGKLDTLLKSSKNVLDSNLKKDSSLLNISQLDDINKESPSK